MKRIISVILLLVMLILTTSCGDIEVIRTKLSYDQELLEEFLKNNWEILPFDKMIELLKKYHGFAGYAKLVDEVGREVDEKLIELANLFAEYHFFLLDLYCADPAQYYSRGYSKVLNLIIN
jgi:hypothetical protein